MLFKRGEFRDSFRKSIVKIKDLHLEKCDDHWIYYVCARYKIKILKLGKKVGCINWVNS